LKRRSGRREAEKSAGQKTGLARISEEGKLKMIEKMKKGKTFRKVC